MRILIVDDSPDIRELFTRRLNDAGYDELLTAESACDAFHVLGLKDPLRKEPAVDLILMDITMPGIDGIEACRRIKATPLIGEIPIIMVTAHDEPSYLEAAFEAGAVGYIKKSANKFELQDTVKRHLALKQDLSSCLRAPHEALDRDSASHRTS